MSNGGRPRNSAKFGEASGFFGSAPCRYRLAMLPMPSVVTIGSAAARVLYESFVQVRSDHGLIQTAAFGSGNLRSRNASNVAAANPPPAESPATARFCGLNP